MFGWSIWPSHLGGEGVLEGGEGVLEGGEGWGVGKDVRRGVRGV